MSEAIIVALTTGGLDVHSVDLLDEEGKVIARKCYKAVEA